MNGAQLHMLFNHLPSIGQMAGFGVFLFGLLFKKNVVQQTGAWVILVSALFVMPANFTGEEAEEVIEHLPGVSKSLIHEHEEAAETALMLTLLSGCAALAYLAFNKWKKNLTSVGTIAVVILCLSSIGFLFSASHKGGLIRHPEISNSATTVPLETEGNLEHDDR